MRFLNYLDEKVVRSNISFVDIDETLFYTFAKVIVIDTITGKKIRKLSNVEYNNYKIKDGEEFNFDQFSDAKFFKETSKPIIPMINRLKKMIKNIKKYSYNSKIILLTARANFDNKNLFLQSFKDVGIDTDFKNFYIERSGNLKTGTTEERKEKIIMKYLKTGNFQTVRMFDDYQGNLSKFMKIADKIDDKTLEKVKIKFEVPDNKWTMQFIALEALENGSLKKYGEKTI